MRLVKGSLAGLVLTGILAIVPAAAFAHGGGGGGGGGHGGGGGGHGFGGGHAFGGGGHAFVGGGHAFGGFTSRGFSPGFSGRRGFSTGSFSVAEMMAVFGIATLDAMGIPEITRSAIIAISSAISISLRSVFLIGGTLTMDTSTTDIPARMRITIPDRLTVTNIGKIWR